MLHPFLVLFSCGTPRIVIMVVICCKQSVCCGPQITECPWPPSLEKETCDRVQEACSCYLKACPYFTCMICLKKKKNKHSRTALALRLFFPGIERLHRGLGVTPAFQTKTKGKEKWNCTCRFILNSNGKEHNFDMYKSWVYYPLERRWVEKLTLVA